MSKPNKHIDWTDGDSQKQVEPSTGKKLLGWTKGEKPPFEWINWLFYTIDLWLKYFDSVIENVEANGSVYDAIVGVNGTHATLEDLMSDSNISNLKNILVISPFTLNNPITLDENDMNFFFKPQATISKGTSAVGIILNGERIRLNNAHFVNFGDTNDESLRLDTLSVNCMVRDCFFTNASSTALVDNGTNNSINGNIEV